MMNIHLPGLSDALTRLDVTEAKMGEIAESLNEIVALLQTQNAMLARMVESMRVVSKL